MKEFDRTHIVDSAKITLELVTTLSSLVISAGMVEVGEVLMALGNGMNRNARSKMGGILEYLGRPEGERDGEQNERKFLNHRLKK